jgi:hypothetical protein
VILVMLASLYMDLDIAKLEELRVVHIRSRIRIERVSTATEVSWKPRTIHSSTPLLISTTFPGHTTRVTAGREASSWGCGRCMVMLLDHRDARHPTTKAQQGPCLSRIPV